ncbi:MAG: gas vesicle protein GvpC [Pseudomonas capeferrum]
MGPRRYRHLGFFLDTYQERLWQAQAQ